MEIKLYSLYSPKRKCLMGVDVESNGDAEFCNSTRANLTGEGDRFPWVTTDREHALKIANQCDDDYPWYSSSPECPSYGSDSKKHYGELQVVEFSFAQVLSK